MNVVNPWLLLGLAGIAVPLLIHWLMRERPRRVALPTVAFVRQAVLRSHRSRKLSGLLLLAVRVVLIVAVALLVARPVWIHSPFVTRSTEPMAVALVVDDAFYTECRVKGRPLLQHAKAAAWRCLDQLPPASLACCLTTSRHAAELTHDLDFVRGTVARLTPQSRPGDLQGAIDRAARLLERHAGPLPRLVVVVSDLNLGLWPSGQPQLSAPPGCRLRLVRLPPRPPEPFLRNVTVAGASHLVTNREFRLDCVLGGADVAGRRVTLELNGRVAAARSVAPPDAAGHARLSLTAALSQPGPGVAKVQLHAADQLPSDNDWYLVLNVHPASRVLCLDGPASSPLRTAELLALALAPPGWLGQQRFDVEVRSIDDETELADLGAFDGIILTGPCRLSPTQWVSLVDAVRRGCGLLIMPDHRTDAEHLNAGALPLLPAPAVVRQMAAAEPLVTLSDTGLAATLAQLGDGALLRLPFRAGYGLAANDEGTVHAVPILGWRSGGWAAASRQLGQGQCLFVGFGPDPAWSDLLGRDVFAPVLHRLVASLTAGREPPLQIACGDQLPLAATAPLPADGNLLLHYPTGGGGIRLAAADAAPESELRATAPGIYRLEQNGRLLAAFAANIRRRDADYSYPPEEALAGLQTDDVAVVSPGEHLSLATRRTHGPLPLAPLLTALFALLLPAEAYLGLRYSCHA